MMHNGNETKGWMMRSGRFLFTWTLCLLLVMSGGLQRKSEAQQQTPQQQQQELERQREEQEREQQAEQERQRQERQRQQEEQQRQQQEEQQRQQEEQRQQQEREQQQREAQQERERQQELERQREQQQHNDGSPARTERPNPVLQQRPVNPEPIQPPRGQQGPPRIDPHPIVPDRTIHPTVGVPVEPGHHPEPAHPVMPPPPGFHPVEPHPIHAPVAVLPVHPLGPLHLPPSYQRGVITERPVVVQPRPTVIVRPSSTEVILGLAPPPGRTVVVMGQSAVVPGMAFVAANPAQNYAAAQARLQAAQASCAQADAYQNNVNTIIANQNNLSQGMDKIVQTLADNTSDPDLQNALLSAVGQPNAINDALDQQLQAQASLYETMCQNRLAAAQAAMPPDPLQQGVVAQPSGQYAAVGAQPANAAPAPAFAQPSTPGMAALPGAGQQPQQQAQSQPCNSGVTMALPPSQAPWRQWVPLGNTGLMLSVSRVNATTLTWRFRNAGSQTVQSMGFNYTYVDADTGQTKTDSDILPFLLMPGQGVGGWAAYTANTRGNVFIQITSIACQ